MAGSSQHMWIEIPFEGELAVGLCCIANVHIDSTNYLFGAIYDGSNFHFFCPSFVDHAGPIVGISATDAEVTNNKFRLYIGGLDNIHKVYGIVFKTDITTFPFI